MPPRKRAPKVVAEDKRLHFGDPGEPLATSPGIKTYHDISTHKTIEIQDNWR